MLSLLSWIVTGFVLGLIARAIIPGPQPLGFILTVGLGVAGAFVGGLLSQLIWPGWVNEPDFNRMWPGWLMAIVGSTLLLGGYVALTRERPGTRLPGGA
jgi:uncharacterized membrane protein YeaQ/YmgE (transglycosylase-associated protein family)